MCVFDNFECSNVDAKTTKLMKLHAKILSIAIMYSEKKEVNFNDRVKWGIKFARSPVKF
jgi:hypothetical protein